MGIVRQRAQHLEHVICKPHGTKSSSPRPTSMGHGEQWAAAAAASRRQPLHCAAPTVSSALSRVSEKAVFGACKCGLTRVRFTGTPDRKPCIAGRTCCLQASSVSRDAASTLLKAQRNLPGTGARALNSSVSESACSLVGTCSQKPPIPTSKEQAVRTGLACLHRETQGRPQGAEQP